MRWIVLLLLLGALSWALVPDESEGAFPAETLAEARADYLEDEHTGRRLAELHVVLERTPATRSTALRVHVAAVGPRVESVPSFRGVHGANHVTARDLTELVRIGSLKCLAMPAGGTGKRFGRIVAGRVGTIPERRLRADGSMELEARSEDFLLEVTAFSPVLADGEHEVYLEARGIPRLRVDVRVSESGTRGTILGIHSLSGHHVETDR